MTLKIDYSLAAENDLRAIFNWVADASDGNRASDYVLRIRARCDALANFSERGTPRNYIATGLRTIAFERSAIIAYLVEPDAVRILRVLRKGRDVDTELHS